MRRRGFVAALAPLATELLLSDVLSCWYVSGVVLPVCTPPVPRCDWHAAQADSDLKFKCAGPGLRLVFKLLPVLTVFTVWKSTYY
jgi:hypothetical protein